MQARTESAEAVIPGANIATCWSSAESVPATLTYDFSEHNKLLPSPASIGSILSPPPEDCRRILSRYDPSTFADDELIQELLFSPATKSLASGGGKCPRNPLHHALAVQEERLRESIPRPPTPHPSFAHPCTPYLPECTDWVSRERRRSPLTITRLPSEPLQLPSPPPSSPVINCSLCGREAHSILECSLQPFVTDSLTDIVIAGGTIDPRLLETPEFLPTGTFHSHDTSSVSSSTVSSLSTGSVRISFGHDVGEDFVVVELPVQDTPNMSNAPSPVPSPSMPELISDTSSSVSSSPPSTSSGNKGFEKFFSDQDCQILCRMTGMARDTNFPDSHVWLRVLFRFLLNYCEGFCTYLGKVFWTHRQHQLVPHVCDNEALVQYLRLFILEPHEKIRTNIYLHPSERNSAYQCLQFINQDQRLSTTNKEE